MATTKTHEGTAPAEVEPVQSNGRTGSSSGLLSRDAILSAIDLPSEVVEVPEWGGSVMVRGLTGAERDGFEISIIETKGKDRNINLSNLRAKLVARSVVDADGQRIFGDADIESLGRKSASALQRVFRIAQNLSGLAPDEVEELAAGLKADPNADSGSA